MKWSANTKQLGWPSRSPRWPTTHPANAPTTRPGERTQRQARLISHRRRLQGIYLLPVNRTDGLGQR